MAVADSSFLLFFFFASDHPISAHFVSMRAWREVFSNDVLSIKKF